MEDQSDPPDAWILWIGEPSGQMCSICQHLCSAAVREDLLGCLSPVMVIRHVSGSGVAQSDAEMSHSYYEKEVGRLWSSPGPEGTECKMTK